MQWFGFQGRGLTDGPDTTTADDVRRSIPLPLALAELDDGSLPVPEALLRCPPHLAPERGRVDVPVPVSADDVLWIATFGTWPV